MQKYALTGHNWSMGGYAMNTWKNMAYPVNGGRGGDMRQKAIEAIKQTQKVALYGTTVQIRNQL